MNQQIEDSIVKAVMTKFYERSQTGIKKYNTTLEKEDYNLIDWLIEAQQEAMDFSLYCEAAINRIKKDGSKTT